MHFLFLILLFLHFLRLLCCRWMHRIIRWAVTDFNEKRGQSRWWAGYSKRLKLMQISDFTHCGLHTGCSDRQEEAWLSPSLSFWVSLGQMWLKWTLSQQTGFAHLVGTLSTDLLRGPCGPGLGPRQVWPRARPCNDSGGAQGKRHSSSHVGPPGARGDREAPCFAWRRRPGWQEIGLKSEVQRRTN